MSVTSPVYGFFMASVVIRDSDLGSRCLPTATAAPPDDRPKYRSRMREPHNPAVRPTLVREVISRIVAVLQVVDAGRIDSCVPPSLLGDSDEPPVLQGFCSRLICGVGPTTVRATVTDPTENIQLSGIERSTKCHKAFHHLPSGGVDTTKNSMNSRACERRAPDRTNEPPVAVLGCRGLFVGRTTHCPAGANGCSSQLISADFAAPSPEASKPCSVPSCKRRAK